MSKPLVVVGAGAWGTAIAIHAARYQAVSLLCRSESAAHTLRTAGENAAYLPQQLFPIGLSVTADAAVLKGAMVLIAVPIAGLADALRQAYAQQAAAAVWLCKGLEASTGQLPHELVKSLNLAMPTGVLSGPSFAQEVAQNLPTALTIASQNPQVCEAVQAALHHGMMRVYTSCDVVGVEVGGAIKNIIALACGISDGLGLGLNARAALMTRGLAEMARLAVALGGNLDTLMGLTGVGDLVLTCTGSLSRNRNYGLLLAKGDAPASIEKHLGHVAEGARCVVAVAARAHSAGVDMPITAIVARIVQGSLQAKDALPLLLAREARAESYTQLN